MTVKAGPLWARARDAYGTGIAVCEHQKHRRLRGIARPAFHRDRLAGYAAIMTRELEAVTRRWQAGQVLDVPAEMYEISTRVAAKTMFAATIAADAIAVVREAISVQLGEFLRRVIVPWRAADRLPTPSNRRFDAAGACLRRVVSEIVASELGEQPDVRRYLTALGHAIAGSLEWSRRTPRYPLRIRATGPSTA